MILLTKHLGQLFSNELTCRTADDFSLYDPFSAMTRQSGSFSTKGHKWVLHHVSMFNKFKGDNNNPIT